MSCEFPFILVNPSLKVKEALAFAYLEDVIKNYEDFKNCMTDLPGLHNLQLRLNLEGV